MDERGGEDEVRQRVHTFVEESVWCVGQTLLLQWLPFVPPDMNAVYSRGVSANIDLSVAAPALRHSLVQPPAFLSSPLLLFIMLFDMETTVQI